MYPDINGGIKGLLTAVSQGYCMSEVAIGICVRVEAKAKYCTEVVYSCGFALWRPHLFHVIEAKIEHFILRT